MIGSNNTNTINNKVYPLVSIVISAYNHETYVNSTLTSIANQSYPNIQLVIIDDGSSDKTADVITEFINDNTSRFINIFYISRPNKGLANTLNECLQHATGEYVYLIASDDIVANNAISILVEAMEENPKLGMACGDASFIDADNKTVVRTSAGKNYHTFVHFFTRNRKFYSIPFNLDNDFGTYESLLGGNYIPIGPLIRKSVYTNIGYYDTTLIYEDYDCWLRIAQHYPIKFIDQILANYRTHDTNANQVLRKRISADRIKIHIREKEYSLSHGYNKAWSLKLVELALGLVASGQWSALKNLISQSTPQQFLTGSTLFLHMLTRRALAKK